MGGNEEKPLLLQEGGLENCKVGTSLCQDLAQGSSRNEPLPDLPKVQQDGAFPNSRSPPPLHKSFYIYIKSKLFTNTSQKVVQKYSIKTQPPV